MEIIPKLTLLQNPRVVENGSIVQAENIIFDSDNTLKVDEIYNNLNLNDKIKQITDNNDYNIVEILNTIDDLILFVVSNKNLYIIKAEIKDDTKIINGFEKILNYEINYCEDINKFELNCTYIYNGNNDLIISYNELYPNVQIPLKVVNINNNIDIKFISSVIPATAPIINITLTNGYFYKGLYNIFIRYKINNDYSNWINVIYNYNLKNIKYEKIIDIDYQQTSTTFSKECLYDYKTPETDLVDEILNLNITHNYIDSTYTYDKYQIGVVIQTNNNTKSFISEDLDINNNNIDINNNNFSSYNLNDLITNYLQIFNCKTLESYNNSLYCANYSKFDETDKFRNIVNNITGKITKISKVISLSYGDIEPDNIINFLNNNNNTLIPYNTYEFYIHFVDEYNNVSNGYLINNITDDTSISDLSFIETLNSYDKVDGYKINLLNLKLNNINVPSNYSYFITYKENKKIIFAGILLKGDLNYDDSDVYYNLYLNNDYLNINPKLYKTSKLKCVKCKYSTYVYSAKKINETYYFPYYEDIIDVDITNVNIIPANDINNAGKNTKLHITGSNRLSDTRYVCYFEIDNYKSDLIRCSDISKNSTIVVNNFKSKISLSANIVFNKNGVYFDENNYLYKNLKTNDVFSAGAISLSKFFVISYEDYECKCFNNKPKIYVNHKNETIQIVTPQNTIDLYKNDINDIQDLFIYDIYNDDIDNKINFPNTLRRSEPILDESNKISWRKFNINSYKNIINNKGEIIKLINSGNTLLIHTNKTLFLLDGSDSIKSTNEGNIQLSSIDIWDVNFKELIPSENAYAGLKNKNKSILGEFGYIWYNEDKLFRFDNNNQLNVISDDVYNFLKQYNYKIDSIYDDWYNTRLIIQCVKENKENIIISYNYRTNSFISTHKFNTYNNIITNLFRFKDIDYIIGYGDSNLNNDNIYRLNNNKDNKINGFIDIIFNDKYDVIKYLEYIKYKLTIKDIDFNNNDNILLQNKKIAYPGDKIRIYSEYCDTGLIDIKSKNNDSENILNYNNIDSKLPYWDLGTWNFNNIRNKIKDSDLYTDLNDNEQSLIFGNYFVVRIIFDTKNRIGIDSIEFYTKQKI